MSDSPVAVITGAGSGIGRALAQRLAQRGFRLALNDVNAAALDETRASLAGEVELGAFDVSKREAMEAFRDQVLQRFGRADWVVNNAGVDLAQAITDVGYDDFEWLMGINFWGVVHGTKAFLPALLRQKSGVVVNVSSVFGLVGYQMHGTYCASKFAVRGFTEALRYELRGTGVRAVCVHPGGIKTNIVRNSRFRADAGGIDKDDAVSFFDHIARTSAEQAARVIADGVEAGKSRILVGGDAVAIDAAQRLLPVAHQGLFLKVGPKAKPRAQVKREEG
jgi:NAD(P)-dependent dehydrogenase (short-subunit alcohol dehydrogenase family)